MDPKNDRFLREKYETSCHFPSTIILDDHRKSAWGDSDHMVTESLWSKIQGSDHCQNSRSNGFAASSDHLQPIITLLLFVSQEKPCFLHSINTIWWTYPTWCGMTLHTCFRSTWKSLMEKISAWWLSEDASEDPCCEVPLMAECRVIAPWVSDYGALWSSAVRHKEWRDCCQDAFPFLYCLTCANPVFSHVWQPSC